jgi:hypothetical protein
MAPSKWERPATAPVNGPQDAFPGGNCSSNIAPKTARAQAEKNEKNLFNGRYLRHREMLILDVPKRLWCKIQCKGIWERSAFRLSYPDVIELLAHARRLERAADERAGGQP